MDTIVSSQCSNGAEEICISKCEDASKPPETASSSSPSDEAKDNKMSDAATCTRAFATSVSVHPFKTRDEFLSAMMEDVTEWLNSLFGLNIKSSELMLHLETGALLCRLANMLDLLMVGDDKKHDSESADKDALNNKDPQGLTSAIRRSVATRPLAAFGGSGAVLFRENAPRGSFQSRDNISNFLNWCRNRLKLSDTVLFETEDLVAGRNERNVILCMLEVARRGSKHGMPVPELIELESEIDAELGQESMAEDGSEAERLRQKEEEEEEEEEEERRIGENDRICDVERSVDEDMGAMTAFSAGGRKELEPITCGATPSYPARFCLRIRDLLRMRDRRPEVHRMREVIQMDVLTLDELVRRFLGNCKCSHQYPMIKVSEGKYRIGENLMLIFVRLLRSHVMLRIGGGWETLADYLSRHDPCRAAEQHRQKEKPTHANEETMPSKDESTPTNDENISEKDRNTPAEDRNTPAEDRNTPAEDRNAPAEDRNTPAEDRNTPAEDRNAPAKDKTTPENNENTPREDKNRPLQDLNAPEKDENSPTGNKTTQANDEITQENEEMREMSEDAKQQEVNLNEINENVSA